MILSSYVINIIKPRKMRLAVRVGRVRSAVQSKKWGQISDGERPFGSGRFCWNIKIGVKRAKICVNWAERQFQDRILW